MSDNKWGIKVEELEGPSRDRWGVLKDEFYESPSGEFGILIYSVAEVRMGWYLGRIALFTNKSSPELIVSPDSVFANGYNSHCFYSSDSMLLFVNISIRLESQNNIYIPILMIDLRLRKYSVIPLVNGFNYSVEEVECNKFKLVENYRDQRFESYNGLTINPEEFNWYELNRLDEVRELFNFNHWN